MTTLLYTHPAAALHQTPDGHAEQTLRITAVEEALCDMDLMRLCAPMATEAQVLRAHPRRYLENLRSQTPETGMVQLDPDTHMSHASLEAAMRAAGAACHAVDRVMNGANANAFIAMRPPGHHAERETAMGFCLLGTVAIAAKHAIQHHGLKRVAVIDFDVHHGNGTQDLLWNEPNALFFSSHQMPLYPGTGAKDETGAHGTIINIPLPEGSDGARMRQTYEMQVLPKLRAYAPQLILVSAGFDAHKEDPLAQLNWNTDDFSWLTRQLCEIAEATCNGRLVSTLEGGYDLTALAASAAAHVRVLSEFSK